MDNTSLLAVAKLALILESAQRAVHAIQKNPECAAAVRALDAMDKAHAALEEGILPAGPLLIPATAV